MRYEDVVSNVNIYGFEESVLGSGFAAGMDQANDKVTERALELAKGRGGIGSDNFLNGVIVQFDLTFSNKAWADAERYPFLDFVRSQTTMQRIMTFDLDEAYVEYTDPRIIEIMKEKTREYNDLQEDIARLQKEGKDISTLLDLSNQKYLEISYSNPNGFRLTARMTTNYRQLKTIYAQRRNHRLPEWRAFCSWLETLPYAEFITSPVQ